MYVLFGGRMDEWKNVEHFWQMWKKRFQAKEKPIFNRSRKCLIVIPVIQTYIRRPDLTRMNANAAQSAVFRSIPGQFMVFPFLQS